MDEMTDSAGRRWAWAVVTARWLLAAAYLFAGLMHVRSPELLLPIVPDWVPSARLVVIATGWCEIAGALALLTRRLRWWAGVMLALYAACVFPANVKHAIDDLSAGSGLPLWYHGPRLVMQPVIIAWTLWVGGVWPVPARRRD